MFRNAISIYFIAFISITTSCQQDKVATDPSSYDYRLSTELADVQRELYFLFDIITTNDLKSINKQFETSKKQVDKSLLLIQKLPDMNEDLQYRETVLSLLQFYKKSFSKYYAQIIRISLIPRPSEVEEDYLENIYDELEDIEEPIEDKLIAIRKAFAHKYGLAYVKIKDE